MDNEPLILYLADNDTNIARLIINQWLYLQRRYFICWELLKQLTRLMCLEAASIFSMTYWKDTSIIFSSEDAEIDVNAMKSEMQVEIQR